MPEGGLGPVLSALKSPVVVVDPSGTTVAMRLELEAASARIVSKTSPLTAMKAKKTDAELRAMRSAFKRADRVLM